MMPRSPVAPKPRGFTLVELLVAMTILAMTAILSWRVVDDMARGSERTQQRGDAVATIQMGLAQWSADLDALEPVGGAAPLDWNGQVLRLTRRTVIDNDSSVLVVAWTRRVVGGRSMWLRWQSPPVRHAQEIQETLDKAALWAKNPDESLRRFEVAIFPMVNWQLFYFRQDAWSNPLSSEFVQRNDTLQLAPVPQGVRLVLNLPAGAALAGRITKDWISPTAGGNPS